MALAQGGVSIDTGDDDIEMDVSPIKKQSLVNWDVVKIEWVTTNISLSALAKKYGLTITAVRNHYIRHEWSKALSDYNAQIKDAINRALTDKAEYTAERILLLDESVLSVSEKIIDILDEKVSNIAYLISKERESEISEIDRMNFDGLVKSLKSASEALKNSHYNIRLASDKATAIIDNRGTTEVSLNKTEEERIANELGFIKRKSIPEGTSSQVMDSDKPSQDS